jgi:hypothetical protein
MALPRNGFVQPVEVVAGGPLPRNGFVQPVEVVGGAPASATPVAGGSGQFYASITAALAGETQTVVSGLVPQAGTGPGVIVGPGTLSAVDNFYKDMFILNTSLSPSKGLTAQWARVSSYVGATRTFTIDKPWDFSAEASFEVIDPVRVMLFLDIQEDVTVNKNLVLDLNGNRLQGKIDTSSADFLWIRGGSGYVTNGIQKTDFGFLKIDECVVSRRDATAYALLLTEGSNVGRAELNTCEFMGVVAGRRGFVGWQISNCLNDGQFNSVSGNTPYRLVESVAGVAVVLSSLDVSLLGQWSGACIYSENSISGASQYISILGDISAPKFVFDESLVGINARPQPCIWKCVGAGVITGTLTTSPLSGIIMTVGSAFDPAPQQTVAGDPTGFAVIVAHEMTGSITLTMTGTIFYVNCLGRQFLSGIEIQGTATSTGNVAITGGRLECSGAESALAGVHLGAPYTGTITCPILFLVRGFVQVATSIRFAANQTAGAPSVTLSGQFITEGSNFWTAYTFEAMVSSISVGTWAVSGAITAYCINASAMVTTNAVVSGGTWTVSGTIVYGFGTRGSATPMEIGGHTGTGGTLTVSSSSVLIYGGLCGQGIVAESTQTGSVTVSGTNTWQGVRFSTLQFLVAGTLIAGGTAIASGASTFSHCRFDIPTLSYVAVTCPAGSSCTGPSSQTFLHCSFSGPVQDQVLGGTITWAASTWTITHCFFSGLITFANAGSFSSVKFFHSHFDGNSSNNSIAYSGTRPTTYQYWKCSFAARPDAAGTPDIIDEYVIVPASGALTAANLVTVNASGQATNVVAGTNVILGVLINSPAGAGNPALVITRGKIMTAVSAGVANGDHLVADTAGTPTNAVTNAASVSGKNVGFALEARGATVANQSYSAIGVN